MSGREFEIIQRYFASLSDQPDYVIAGPGDDCAIVDVPAGVELCVSTDTLIAGVHFLSDAIPEVIAHRSLCANLSDLAAMGAIPYGFTLALTLPSEDEQWLSAYSAHLRDLGRTYAIPLIGGNLARGSLSLTITVMGTTPKGQALRRSGASVGDDIYVSGTLGDAAGGLRQLQQDPRAASALVDRYHYPTPRLDVGEALLGVASAAIDVSDGLMADLGHLCGSSQVAGEVKVDAVPLSAALLELFPNEARAFALGEGDDYELCFTAPASLRDAIAHIAASTGVGITRIGAVTIGAGVRLLDDAGCAITVAKAGYQHFHES